MFAKNYSKIYELFNQDKPYKKEIEMVYAWAEKPKRVLDIGCGTAHYWNYYPDSVAIVGMDRSKDMIRASRNQGLIFHRDIEKGEMFGKDYDLVTALFDVVNYTKNVGCFNLAPVKKGGFLIFDIWDAEKVATDGFEKRVKVVGTAKRTIAPISNDGKKVELMVNVSERGAVFTEVHKMYLHTQKDIETSLGKEFEILETKTTDSWQKWFKLKRK